MYGGKICNENVQFYNRGLKQINLSSIDKTSFEFEKGEDVLPEDRQKRLFS